MNQSAFMENLRQLFAECDTDNNGHLGLVEFSELCAKIGLNREATEETFKRLDIDNNGRITFDEFAAGFNQYKQTAAPTAGKPSAAARPSSSGPQAGTSSAPGTPQPGRGGQLDSGWRPSTPKSSQTSGKLAPAGPVNWRGRKSASPLGVLSLSSAGSSAGNLAGGRSTSTGGLTATDGSSEYNASVDAAGNCTAPVVYSSGVDANQVVYSSDMVGADYGDQASGSDQFGSLMSSNGSFSGLRNMQDLLDCVQKLQSENQVLSQIFFKDKREREEYISQLGEEFDQQVREVEERANRRAREELEAEKRRLREMMDAERETLQHHYQTIERMSKIIKTQPNGKLTEQDGESIHKVRSQLDDTNLENMQLKRSLHDTKMDVAMIWKEMEKLKCQYEDKLSNAFEKNNETRSECDGIKAQLNMIKDSNRKLQDASDVITTYITDKVEPVIKGAEEDPNFLSPNAGVLPGGGGSSLGVNSQSNSRRGSILSEYLLNGNEGQSTANSMDGYQASNNSGDLESLGSPDSRSPQPNVQDRLTSSGQTSNREQQSRSRSSHETVANSSKATHLDESVKKSPSFQQPQASNSSISNSESSVEKQRSIPEVAKATTKTTTSQANAQKGPEDQQQPEQTIIKYNNLKESQSKESISSSSKSSSLKNLGRHFFIGSRAQSDAQVEEAKATSKAANLLAQEDIKKSVSLDQSDEPLVEPADGPSKATFNIILVGDSFVGKSSFAARFMEGSFVQGLISNCSIDFKTKTYKVDGINYTVNLWDTAGQERFRSITASYFRKADGIILMYDVTDKRSYLNVRNWMSTISDTAAENVAVLLIGNKIDLRRKENREKCVPTEEGFRLAKEYEIVFLETSVKTGTNLVPSMGRLIRLIAKNNEPEEEDKDRIRLNDKSKMFNCMPKSC